MNLKVNQPILIVEDSHEDYEATIRAFKKTSLSNPIIRCESGDDALDYLHRRGIYSDQSKFPTPGIILLDLNLPGSDGRDVLKDIKSHDYLKKIPVVVLTTSNDERDIDRCYEAGANSYICKPLNVDGFIRSIQQLKDYWFEIVILPKG
ncbi:MAG: response regulator, partial [Proteobacteria bacterium]|nr:response regulator [Pseudomonadota bacterium]